VGGPGDCSALARLLPRYRIAELERRAVETGRGRVPVSVYAVPGEREVVDRLADAGVDGVLFDLPTLPAEETCRMLDELAAVARSFTV
jgi:hypothetical protein